MGCHLWGRTESDTTERFHFHFHFSLSLSQGFPGGSEVKVSACNAGDWVRSLGQEDPLEKEMAAHSSILAWRILRTEEPGGLPSIGSHRNGHN